MSALVTQRGRADDGRGIPQEAPQTPDDRSSRVDRQIARVGEVAFPTALAQTVSEVLAGLINPLADQRKITSGSHAWGSGMTTMIVIVFCMGLALLLAYFIK